MEELKRKSTKIDRVYGDRRLYYIKKGINEENPANIAELFEELSGEKQLFCFDCLQKDAAAEVFSYMDSDMQEHIVQSITDTEVRNIVDEMF